MHVPLSWLKDFVPLSTSPSEEAEVAELGRVLSSLGLVFEGAELVGSGLDGVVLSRVVALEAIKGADKIRRVLVDAGDPEPVEIVCGAWNFGLGDVVPLARVGTELPNGMVIGRRTMRGVTSNGMLCSPGELGLPGESSGLLVLASPGAGGALPAGIEPGLALAEHLGIAPDAVLDLSIEPNRPDCLSISGIARDLAARLKLPFHLPEPDVSGLEGGEAAAALAAVETRAPSACDRIVGRVLVGLTPVASPPLVARRLILSGMRPIGAVVDASNYAMLELGQPTHPYDLDRIHGARIVARLARPGEVLVTLDGTERVLGRGPNGLGEDVDLLECVIADGRDEVVGLAGVMGGEASEVGAETRRVLLEAAHFNGLMVGRAAKRRGLRTEASVRFERGVDPEGTRRAADRVVELVAAAARHAGATLPGVARGVLEDRPVPATPLRIELRTERMNALLGTELGAAEAAGLLEPIGFTCEPSAEGLLVDVPGFRPDTTAEIDLIEEVARHYGYEQIAPRARRSPAVGRRSHAQLRRRSVMTLLTGLGAHEAWTPSIVDPALEDRLGAAPERLRLTNPIVAEESVLRSSVLAGLCTALRHNVAHRNPHVRLFELGAVFEAPAAGEQWPREREELAVLLAEEGDDAAAASGCFERLVEGLRLAREALELFQGDELVALGADGARLVRAMHPTRRAVACLGGAPLIGFGELDFEVAERFDLGERRIGALVADLGALLAAPERGRSAQAVSRFPSSDVDLAFVLDESVPAERLQRVLEAAGGELLESLRLLDVYRGAPLSAGQRGLAFRLRFCALDRTLDEAELSRARRRCIEAGEAFGARLRA